MNDAATTKRHAAWTRAVDEDADRRNHRYMLRESIVELDAIKERMARLLRGMKQEPAAGRVERSLEHAISVARGEL